MPSELSTDLGCLPKDPVALSGSLYSIGLGLVGGVGILFMVMGAYQILSSAGDPIKIARGKTFIASSIIGIILAVLGMAFYQTVTVDILKLPGFNR